jgi:hypothetical protein
VLKLLKSSTGSNLADMGRSAVHVLCDVEGATPMLVDSAGQEATTKACGVVVAMLQGHSWAPHPITGSW